MLSKIISYTFYLTNQCMLDCPYCYESCFRKQNGVYKMPLSEIYAIIDFANNNYTVEQGIIEFALFGGEPLFYLHNQILPIIDYLKTHFHHPFRITIMTNGINLTNELISKLQQLPDYFALISLDAPFKYLDNPSMNQQMFNRIIDNITTISEEERKKHIGLKTTLTNNTITHIKEIYQFLESLNCAVIYMSPVHEIDTTNFQIYLPLIQNKLVNTRDGQLLTQKYALPTGIKLFIKNGNITLRQDSVRSPLNLPIGWIVNNKVIISDKLLTEAYNTLSNKFFLTPKDKNKCIKCKLKNSFCSPDFTFYGDPLASTGCEWYTELKEIIDAISN